MLTEVKIKALKAKDKPYKSYDAGGLFLQVMPSGSKLWRFRYQFAGRAKLLSLGGYPETKLKEARDLRDDARKMIRDGDDPGAVRQARKAKAAKIDGDTFKAVALEWFAKKEKTWVPNHADRLQRLMERDIFPWLGKRSIHGIEAPEILTMLRRIEGRGAVDTSHRALQLCGNVFRYAVSTHRIKSDPCRDLRGALESVKGGNFARITEPKEIGDLLRAIDAYEGTLVVKCALKLAPLVFVRPGELRRAEWSEIDLDNAEWRIPAEKMKMRQPHIVPLSTQAVAILRELEPLTGQPIPGKPDAPRYVFPSERGRSRPMSDGAVLVALRRMGYTKEQMTGHGFRSMASTRLHEMGYESDWIEVQLAHKVGSSVKSAYNYAQYLPARKKMMQEWSDYLDGLKTGADVVAIHKGKSA